jgi:hypothetical protein
MESEVLFMSVQKLKVAGRDFVLVPKRDYDRLRAAAKDRATTKPARRRTRLSAQDRADLAEARRRLADTSYKAIPWEQAKKELGME